MSKRHFFSFSGLDSWNPGDAALCRITPSLHTHWHTPPCCEITFRHRRALIPPSLAFFLNLSDYPNRFFSLSLSLSSTLLHTHASVDKTTLKLEHRNRPHVTCWIKCSHPLACLLDISLAIWGSSNFSSTLDEVILSWGEERELRRELVVVMEEEENVVVRGGGVTWRWEEKWKCVCV